MGEGKAPNINESEKSKFVAMTNRTADAALFVKPDGPLFSTVFVFEGERSIFKRPENINY